MTRENRSPGTESAPTTLPAFVRSVLNLPWRTLLQFAAVLLVAAIAACAALAPAQARAGGTATIEIVTKTGVHAFSVELATTNTQRQRGLMFRKSLPEGHGMLFDFKVDQDVSFWMHNTYIPLDMIFIAGNGRIVHIARNAKPMSDALIPSDYPVRAVLEVIAGTADNLDIAVGDQVSGSIFGTSR
jgi:uncharacterized protein